MTQQLLKSRLLVSAQCAPEQMQPDFETQFEEFKAIVHSVLYSESGYLAIAQSLDEAAGVEIAPKPKFTSASASPAYRKLEDVADALQEVVKANRGGTNKDLAAFTAELQALVEKWKR